MPEWTNDDRHRDSQVPIGTGQGVYMAAVAQEAAGAALDRGLEVFSRRSLAHGGAAWTRKDVEALAGLRLYRATGQDHSILAKDGRPDYRIPAHLNSPGPGHTLKPLSGQYPVTGFAARSTRS
jgi:hypothetical protein